MSAETMGVRSDNWTVQSAGDSAMVKRAVKRELTISANIIGYPLQL